MPALPKCVHAPTRMGGWEIYENFKPSGDGPVFFCPKDRANEYNLNLMGE